MATRTSPATARQIIAALEAPILFEGQPLDVGTSIGIAHFPEHGQDAQTLVRNADIAMYAAKRNKTGFATYDPHYDTSQQEHLSLLGELRRAVERNELRLYYQPKVSLHSSHVSAVEALIRWEHPMRGLVSPAQFIPFAEHTGYIKLLTRWVLREAVRQCGEWLREGLRAAGVGEHLGARSHEPRAARPRRGAAGRTRRHARACCAWRSPRADSWKIRRTRRRCSTVSPSSA